MMTMVTADGQKEYALLEQLAARSGEVDRKVTAAVTEILDTVRADGDAALREYTRRFDGVDAPVRSIPRGQLEALAQKCSRRVYDALCRAAENIRDFHRRQLQQSWLTAREDGTILGQRVRGLDKVGIYVPGGTAAYPSSVLMNAIPARIAGVREIIMVTPPPKNGEYNYDVMAAAYIAGVDRVILCGGAQAVAALAYGTETVPKVDKIVGPGNIYVATAKRLLFGKVDIDMVAGPSEILILADRTAEPAYLAADLMSQAEHDRLASAILLTDDASVAERTLAELEKQIVTQPRATPENSSEAEYSSVRSTVNSA